MSADPRPVCEGFCWIGQSFRYCDRCGNPYWEHTHDERPDRSGGPFSGTFVLVPITDERRASARAKWGSDDVG